MPRRLLRRRWKKIKLITKPLPRLRKKQLRTFIKPKRPSLNGKERSLTPSLPWKPPSMKLKKPRNLTMLTKRLKLMLRKPLKKLKNPEMKFLRNTKKLNLLTKV